MKYFIHTIEKSREIILVFVIALFYITTSNLNANTTWIASLDEGIKIAKKNNRPIVLDIYAPWCPYCQKMQKKVYPFSEIKEILNDFVLVRIDGEKNRAISKKFRVRGFPTIVFLDKNGKQISISRGYLSKKALKAKLNEILAYAKREKEIIKQLKNKPQNVYLNYKAGLVYYQQADLKNAEIYFSKANLSREPVSRYKIDALYNLAVVQMDKEDYKMAIRRWNEYLKKYPNQGQDSIYARYYRGISFYFTSNKSLAKKDLAWATKNLKNNFDIKNANDLLQKVN